jgi:hypothetical protein
MVSNCGAIDPFAEVSKGDISNRVSTNDMMGERAWERLREKSTHPNVAVDDETDAE